MLPQRWVNQLAEFTFSIPYKPGKQYVIADTLSPTPESRHTKYHRSMHLIK